ncbi:MAG: hypothetical protein A3J62_00800 [Candidatus Buchananbacteria bacterium RIFCSPHIGHO2_02_FULL_38_8]|uniref:Glucose-1-phosphate thymidylyltransferase n=1 Tax=Candidatus Buchananbacteria bacterium RIFCSPHIGHO2_02_FULL_38_8 TaxID=1797538 RepID=A0A1G1Y6D6_9BACT|nr:MAG: hypothetical protein A3J62_00800 [Candidatus Buchananbacteria bacterium RIFCSPHIGHO2_02_FULL_38_8]
MKVILFEDKKIEDLHPITLTRPGFDILCGGVTLIELLRQQFKPAKIDFLVRDYLKKICHQRYRPFLKPDSEILFLDSCLVPSFEMIKFLAKKVAVDKSVVFKNKNQILGAYLGLKEFSFRPDKIKRLKFLEVEKFLSGLKLKIEKVNWKTFEHPWDVITYNEEILPENLKYISSKLKEIKPKVFIGKNVKIEEYVSFNSADGPIVIDDNTWIKSMSVLCGPIYIGKNCIINSHAEIKHSACIGEVCKVGGEVEVSVFQGYSNKQHLGFLGSSYIGSWINIGAGTTNSDLKNTYSTVKMLGYDTKKKFLGCIIGDYSKTSINTSIFTGKVIGVNSFLYGTIDNDVPSFTNSGSQFDVPIEFLLAAAIKVQKAMMQRRKIKQTAADIKLLKDIFEFTKKERKQANVKQGKLFFNNK